LPWPADFNRGGGGRGSGCLGSRHEALWG
jgi:hypothetical protein